MVNQLPFQLIATLTAHATCNTERCEVVVGESLDASGNPLFRVWVPGGAMPDGSMYAESRDLRTATTIANKVITNILLGN